AAIDRLHDITLEGAPVPAFLDSAYYYKCVYYNQCAAILTFVLLYSNWRWRSHLDEDDSRNPAVRRMNWATLTVAIAVIAMAVAPRRLVFDRFNTVLFENHLSFVIATNSDELLLYTAEAADSIRTHIRNDAQGLVSKETRRIVTR